MRKSFVSTFALLVVGSLRIFAQEPVVGAADGEALFHDKDPKLDRNKQAAMHIVIDLLECGHWNEAEKWLTERYVQHNPNFGSGRDPIVRAFGKNTPRPVPEPKDWRTKVVAVLAQGDLVAVATRSERPDPRTPGQTYTTTHFDMWRFVDGKADEHWDEGQIAALNPNAGKGKQ
ncbi:MAG TPA: nuclear transport factor 2 family protein [Bryobacteraceae bacterium]|jgi:predicted SnoaL-like aldol condensation-catalyzing enzyme|nr:nuclear transport factor 2 family protein [Bryobacteraceae bacterium]